MLGYQKGSELRKYIFVLYCFVALTTSLEVSIIRRGENVEKLIVSNNDVLNLHRSDFPLLLTCSDNQATEWEIKRHCALESSACSPEIKYGVSRSVGTESGSGGPLFISELNITNYTPQLIGSYACKGSSAMLTFGLSLKQDTNEVTSFLHPGSSHIVVPILGEKLIVLPCHLYSSNSDVEVEKISAWTTRKIDAEYDPLLSSFVLRLPTGSYDEIKHYVGTYRFSQIGFDAKEGVTVEVLSPTSHTYHPKAESITVKKGDIICLSCSSKTPIKLYRDGYNLGYSTQYNFQPEQNLRYKATLNYSVPVAEIGQFSCVTDSEDVIYVWKYEFRDVSLSHNGAEIMLQTSGRETTSPKFTISPCNNYPTCKFLGETWGNTNLDTINHQSCGEGCYSIKPEIKSPFLLTYAATEVVAKAIFFWDIDNKLVELRDELIYHMDSMMTIFYENVREEGVHKITCQWIPFFLGESVERELNGERIQRDKITIENHQSDIKMSSTIKIRHGEGSFYKNNQLNTSCIPVIWDKAKIYQSFNFPSLHLVLIDEAVKSQTFTCQNVEVKPETIKKKEEPTSEERVDENEDWRKGLYTFLVPLYILLAINIILTSLDLLSRSSGPPRRQLQPLNLSEVNEQLARFGINRNEPYIRS